MKKNPYSDNAWRKSRQKHKITFLFDRNTIRIDSIIPFNRIPEHIKLDLTKNSLPRKYLAIIGRITNAKIV